jgi:hypothetical protein
VFTEGIGGAQFGTGELRDDLAKGAGWVITLAVAEWAIRRPARPKAPAPCSSHRWSGPHHHTSRRTVMTTGSALNHEFRVESHLDDRWSAELASSPSPGTTTAPRRWPDRSQTRLSCTACLPGCATSAPYCCR